MRESLFTFQLRSAEIRQIEGSSLMINSNFSFFRFFITFRSVPEADIVLHFNPRLDQNKVIMNDRKDGNWGVEEMQPLIVMQSDSSAVRVFAPGQTTQILIECEAAHLKV